jgi:hypothetical protein
VTRYACCLLALLCAGIVHAAEERLQLVGEARLTVMVWPIYESRLYTADGNYTEGQRPLRLELEYLRDIEALDLVEHTRKEWRHLQMLSGQENVWLESLSSLWPDVSENDVLALVLDEGGRSTFMLNGESLGGIDDPAFGPSFLAIWLSPATSRPELRRALIGMN